MLYFYALWKRNIEMEPSEKFIKSMVFWRWQGI